MSRKLYRSRSNAMVAGVCGGLGEYLGVDPTLVRLFFTLLVLAGGGTGMLVYLLLWMILPYEGEEESSTLGDNVRSGSQEIAEHARRMGEDFRHMVREPNPQAALIIGSAVFLMGVYFLLRNLDLPWLSRLDFSIVWPSLLILGGIVLLYRYFKER